MTVEAALGTTTNFPSSSEEVLAVITAAERHRKFVWTAARVLREAALRTGLETLRYRERKLVLKRLATFLEDLAAEGVLQRRREVQSIGYGDEVGFDYVGSVKTAGPVRARND
ncbi:MAG TPA: hypothetical protein VKR60_00030 [Candidatus Sulfotelmatobacter sp.]|nr:hypothetical protein [Candidatus Sulfotelmatobacter sp.]